MKITNVAAEVAMELEETQDSRDKRIEELWRRLNPQGHAELDLKGLKKGLRRIDHPMKNADDMLGRIVKTVDTNGDGKIQYEEFHVFVEAAERQLLSLFQSIDRDHDGRLGKNELCAAFKRAGIAVPLRRLSGFFDKLDMNHDGFITFEEWRVSSTLEAALSFYIDIVTLNPEGDSIVNEKTLEGLGMTEFFVQTLFGSIIRIASPPDGPLRRPTGQKVSPGPTSSALSATIVSLASTASFKTPGSANGTEALAGTAGSFATAPFSHNPSSGTYEAYGCGLADDAGAHIPVVQHEGLMTRLTDLLPEPGYFLAGAISGGVSRTATAPLDRLKVCLLVNTKVGASAVMDAAKQGHAISSARKGSGPIVDAVVSLWKAGGVKTFFAGNGLNVIKIMPESAIRFGSYEASKRFLAAYEGHGDPHQINTVSKFVAGGIGGMTAQFCVYPIDTLKFRLQCETVEGGLEGNALLMRTARKMLAEGGLRAAYRGLGLGLVGMFPYSAIDIGTFEFLKKSFAQYKARYYGIHEEDATPGNFATALLGASSGALGATVVYPLNVLRTRLQTQGTLMHPPTYTGIWDVTYRTFVNEGGRGLFKGLTPNILKVAPALSITWVCYENTKKFLELH